IVWQLRLEASGLAQRIAGLPVLNGPDQQFMVRAGQPVAIYESPVGLPWQLLEFELVERSAIGVGLSELQVASPFSIGLCVECRDQLRNGRLQTVWIVNLS